MPRFPIRLDRFLEVEHKVHLPRGMCAVGVDMHGDEVGVAGSEAPRSYFCPKSVFGAEFYPDVPFTVLSPGPAASEIHALV